MLIPPPEGEGRPEQLGKKGVEAQLGGKFDGFRRVFIGIGAFQANAPVAVSGFLGDLYRQGR